MTTILLAIQNRQARPERYAVKKEIRTTGAARTMVVSGLIVLCFVIYHLLQFTIRPEWLGIKSHTLPTGHNDVYTMVIMGFSNPYATAFYILGLFLLSMHLSHGFLQLYADARPQQQENRAHPRNRRDRARVADLRRLYLDPRVDLPGILKLK